VRALQNFTYGKSHTGPRREIKGPRDKLILVVLKIKPDGLGRAAGPF